VAAGAHACPNHNKNVQKQKSHEIEALKKPNNPLYLLGAAGAGVDAGVEETGGGGGADDPTGAFSFWNIDFGPCRKAITPNEREVTMNKIADQVVARESAVAAPRGPNAV
jgi:hypothetical protein